MDAFLGIEPAEFETVCHDQKWLPGSRVSYNSKEAAVAGHIAIVAAFFNEEL